MDVGVSGNVVYTVYMPQLWQFQWGKLCSVDSGVFFWWNPYVLRNLFWYKKRAYIHIYIYYIDRYFDPDSTRGKNGLCFKFNICTQCFLYVDFKMGSGITFLERWSKTWKQENDCKSSDLFLHKTSTTSSSFHLVHAYPHSRPPQNV